MKDESNGVTIQEFVGLRPKMYSLLYTETNKTVEKKVAKGVAKHITKREIRHEFYKQCLFNQGQEIVSMRQLRSYNHNIFSINLNKVGLSPFNNKRYILNNGFDSIAYRHYTIRNNNLEQHDHELIELLVDL